MDQNTEPLDPPKPPDAAAICDAIGRQKIARAVGVGSTAVSNAAVEGLFPSKWYPVVKGLCDEDGIECPLSAFSFILERAA